MFKLLSITLVNSAYTMAHSQLSRDLTASELQYKAVKFGFANTYILKNHWVNTEERRTHFNYSSTCSTFQTLEQDARNSWPISINKARAKVHFGVLSEAKLQSSQNTLHMPMSKITYFFKLRGKKDNLT
jgi:hypothetical protein